MHPSQLSFSERVALATAFTRALFADEDAAARAIVRDGWPEPMARVGLRMHRHTWQVHQAVAALERELAPYGGLQALEGMTREGWQITAPRELVHIWPALPGAGLTPVLFGWLLGAGQRVRPSRRGEHFATHLHGVWEETIGREDGLLLPFDAPNPRWRDVDALVVSGADDTLDALHDFVGRPRHRQRPLFMGYGHRVSFAVIVDSGTPRVFDDARPLARDVVMWHQTGCFSARAVIFCGSPQRAEAFGQALGAAIEVEERALGATTLDEGGLARRAQARGVAEFSGAVYGEGLGWVQPRSTPFRGEQLSPHTVSLHTIPNLAALPTMIGLPTHQVQGVALGTYGGDAERLAWADALARRGATRICRPGALQSPPAAWMHDGWGNVSDWLRVTMMDA